MASDRLLVNTTGIEQAITGLQHVEYEIERAAYLLSRIDLTESIGLQAYDEVLEIYTKQLKNQSRKVESLAAKTQQVLDKFVATENDLANPKDVDFPTLGAVVSGDDGVVREVNEYGETIETYPDGRVVTIYEEGERIVHAPYKFEDGVIGYIEEYYNSDGERYRVVKTRIDKSEYYGEYVTNYEYDGTDDEWLESSSWHSVNDHDKEKIRTYELTEQDELWNSAQSEKAIMEQIDLFYANWEKWEKNDKIKDREKLLLQQYKEICKINGTDSNDVKFIVIEANNKEDAVTKKGVELGPSVYGYYNHESKQMVIRVSPDRSYAEIMSTLAHESRHQLQWELIKGTATKEYDVNENYIDQLRNETNASINHSSNFENTQNSNTIGFYNELINKGLTEERAIEHVNDYIQNGLYRDQQLEVDAWRTQYEVEGKLNKLREMQYGIYYG